MIPKDTSTYCMKTSYLNHKAYILLPQRAVSRGFWDHFRSVKWNKIIHQLQTNSRFWEVGLDMNRAKSPGWLLTITNGFSASEFPCLKSQAKEDQEKQASFSTAKFSQYLSQVKLFRELWSALSFFPLKYWFSINKGALQNQTLRDQTFHSLQCSPAPLRSKLDFFLF